jgi:hypothetical protein
MRNRATKLTRPDNRNIDEVVHVPATFYFVSFRLR